ncbi:hypothetical protein GGR57DRAFT_501034 [Xylariaceae sp. FL1272]|nr:hypothetical protein GGR57DRAFT_501034 [Xylariaceae sp. FL1272]
MSFWTSVNSRLFDPSPPPLPVRLTGRKPTTTGHQLRAPPPLPPRSATTGDQAPDPRVPNNQTSTISLPLANQGDSGVYPSQAQLARECISSPVSFGTTWYQHPLALDYYICANCYDQLIRGTRFGALFRGTFYDDKQFRGCLFSTPRMKSLFNNALETGSIDGVLEHMKFRSSIPGCRGQGGAKSDAGVKWYRAKDNAIPAMVVCQACYEDIVLAYREFGEAHFEVCPVPQAPDAVWACDVAIPFILREYKWRAANQDWENFVGESSARITFPPCPGQKTVYPDGKQWFTPINGSWGFLICVTCFCDYVILTGQDSKWCSAGDDLVKTFGVSVRCCFGQFNLKALASRTLDTTDYAHFWRAIDIISHEPLCDPKRIQNGTWYTLHSNPSNFEICRSCFVTIVEPFGVGHHFMLKPGTALENALLCSFNLGVARFSSYMKKFLEMVYKLDPAPLLEFIEVYATMPVCRGAKRVENVCWYGWDECTICPECHHEFIRGTKLASTMPHQGIQVKAGIMCCMYSPRMRKLYMEACASEPPDPTPLLKFSVQRRAIWAETVPRLREIRNKQALQMGRQTRLLQDAMFYTWSGNLMQNSLPLEQTWGNTALGAGLYNHMQIKGAESSQQASIAGSQLAESASHLSAAELEARWAEVE